jgi:membrane protease YdiL (CAAX protease family)
MTSPELVTYDLGHWPAAARDAVREELARAGIPAQWVSATFAVPGADRTTVDAVIARLNGTAPATGAVGVTGGGNGAAAPPGWYADPLREALWRWWDGRHWTGFVGPQVTRERGWFPPRGDHEQVARGGGLALIGFFGGQLLSVGLVLLAIALGAQERSVGTLLIGELGLWAGLFGACVLAVRRYGSGRLRDLGLVRLRAGDAGIGVLAAIVARIGTIVIAVIVILVFGLDDLTRETSVTDQATLSVVGAIVTALIVVVGAPFFEELFFRGLVQGVLTRRYGGRVAIVTQAVAFGLVHYQIGMTRGQAILTFAMIVPVGFLLGCLRWRYQRLGPGMVTHAVFNAMTVAVLFATA